MAPKRGSRFCWQNCIETPRGSFFVLGVGEMATPPGLEPGDRQSESDHRDTGLV